MMTPLAWPPTVKPAPSLAIAIFGAHNFAAYGRSAEMCARIGMVTGRGLAANIRLHFSNRVLRVVTLMLFERPTPLTWRRRFRRYCPGAGAALAPNVPVLSLVVGFAASVCSCKFYTVC